MKVNDSLETIVETMLKEDPRFEYPPSHARSVINTGGRKDLEYALKVCNAVATLDMPIAQDDELGNLCEQFDQACQIFAHEWQNKFAKFIQPKK